MKKLFIIMCLFPLISMGQNMVIKDVYLPRLVVDSTNQLMAFRVNTPAPGAKKEKLVAVLSKWMTDNYTATTKSGTSTGDDVVMLSGEGIFLGTVAAQRQQYDINATDRLATNLPTVDYKVRFTMTIAVTDEKYSIVISKFNLDLFNTITPIELFYKNLSFPNIPLPEEQRGMDTGEMYVKLFSGMNSSLQDVSKSAAKCITKAKKKGDL